MDLLDALAVVRRVAELASFTRAAEELGRPKASVSAIVRALELRLGTRLLHRTTRRVVLTADGAAVLERARAMLDDADELQSMFRADGDITGRIRVDMPTGTARHIVAPALPEFLAAHPHVEIELGSTDRRVDPVRDGYDCVLRVGTVRDSSLVARPLGCFRVLSVASPAYVARYGAPASIDDLASHRLVGYAQMPGTPADGFEYVDSDGNVRMCPMPTPVVVNNGETYQAACLAGVGIIQAPEPGVRALVDDGLLLDLLVHAQAEPMPVTLLYPHRRHLPRRVRVFMAWIEDVVRPYTMEGARD